MTRWIGAAGIAGAGLFAAVAAKAQPGRSTVSTPVATTPATSADGAGSSSPVFTPSTDSQGGGGVVAPAQASPPDAGPPDAVSRGS